MMCLRGQVTHGHVNAWANPGQDHVGWCFEEYVTDEEDEENDGVVGRAHVELVAHASLNELCQHSGLGKYSPSVTFIG